MQVVLLGVSDRAVHLERRPRGAAGRVGAGHLGRRHVPGRVLVVPVERGGRGVQQRPGELQADRHVGELVLDRLERPDRPAELGPLPGVPDAGLQQGTARAEQLRGTGQRARVQPPGYRGGHCGPTGQQSAGGDLRQRPARVHGPIPATRSSDPHRVTRGEQGKAAGAGVHRPRQPRRHGGRGDQLPGGKPGKPRSGPAPGGQVPTGQALVGQVPTSQVPTSQVSGGHLPTSQASGGHLPTGQVSGGHLPTGQVSGGHLPTGQVPGGHLPTGQVPGGGAGGQRGEQHGNGGDRLGHRAGHRVMAEFLASDHDIGEAGTETAIALGHRQCGDS